eukprot:256927_1
MIMPQSIQQPVGPNDIFIKEAEGSYPPQWIPTLPTPLLIQKGLTLNLLKQEIQFINTLTIECMSELTSVKHGKNERYKKPLFTSIIGMVLVIATVPCCIAFGPTAGVLVFLGIFIVVGSGVWSAAIEAAITTEENKAFNRGFSKIKEYIECDLNSKYQPQGIRWTLYPEQRSSYKFSNTSDSPVNNLIQIRYHILISNVDVGTLNTNDIHVPIGMENEMDHEQVTEGVSTALYQ